MFNEEAFYFANQFSFKLTAFGKKAIKAGFPLYTKDRWVEKCQQKNISFVVFGAEGEVLYEHAGKEPLAIDTEAYNLAYRRILLLDKAEVEEKGQKNFLLKQKLESVYHKMLISIMKFPKKERFYIRGKLEKAMLDVLHDVYTFAYEPQLRAQKIGDIMSGLLVFREFLRLAYSIGNYMKDTAYFDITGDLVESMKIAKTLKNKYEKEEVVEV